MEMKKKKKNRCFQPQTRLDLLVSVASYSVMNGRLSAYFSSSCASNSSSYAPSDAWLLTRSS